MTIHEQVPSPLALSCLKQQFDEAWWHDFLRQTRGPVWVTEVGAVNFFGKGLPPSIRRRQW